MKSRHVAFLVIAACAAGVLLLPAACKAATLTGTFTQASSYEDGSVLPAANVRHTRVEVGTCGVAGGFGTKEGETLVPSGSGTLAFSATVPRVFGDFCLRAQTETTSGALSVFTALVKVTKVEPKPSPPTGLTVSVQTAFMAVRQNDAYVMLPVGSVPGGTKCDPNNGVIAGGKSYFAVPSNAVQWYGSTQPTVTLATCS